MNEAIKRQLNFIESRAHRKYRRELTEEERLGISQQIQDRNKSLMDRVTLRLKLFLEAETPVIMEDTRIHGLRTIVDFPDIYSEEECREIHSKYFVHEKGKVCNLACDYGTVLHEGLEGRRARLLGASLLKSADPEFIHNSFETIDIIEAFVDRYAQSLDDAGKDQSAGMLRRIIRHGATGFLEALQLFRLLHFSLWCAGNYHNTVGRFDQYFYPFYKADKDRGVLNDEEALELVEDFFLSFNRDSDLYYSLQWGDNGQSLVLGGCTPEGVTAVNELTYISLKASLELRQIDPKINLRVDRNTPFELYMLGTELTRVGMGFPQYSNDDVVIPGLIRLGYSPEHARDYVMAACWEFIVPGVAMDIPNIGAVPLASVVHETIIESLDSCPDFDYLLANVKQKLYSTVREMASGLGPLFVEPSPLQSLLMRNCADEGQDISKGSLYNNYGFHGTGFSCAVDQLAAVKRYIFEEKMPVHRLLNTLKNNFQDDLELKHLLRTKAPKIGRDEQADEIGNSLLAMFGQSLQGIFNERGGIIRAGTGSAMYYLWHAKNLPATSDGRTAEEPLPANFSPALFISETGPLSVISGFAMESLKLAVNGGPLTLELHDSVFKNQEGVEKVAQLVQTYILKGGHQLQLNAVNREKLKDAQAHPEKHKDLIVRVWGWSGHFVELDKAYQEQILSRAEFGSP